MVLIGCWPLLTNFNKRSRSAGGRLIVCLGIALTYPNPALSSSYGTRVPGKTRIKLLNGLVAPNKHPISFAECGQPIFIPLWVHGQANEQLLSKSFAGLFPFSAHSLAAACGEFMEKSWGIVEVLAGREFVTFLHLAHLMR